MNAQQTAPDTPSPAKAQGRWLPWLLVTGVAGALVATSMLGTLDGMETQYIRLQQAGFYAAVIWLVMLAAVRRAWVALALALPVAIFLPLEVWLRLQIGHKTNAQTWALLAETTPAEAVNFIIAYGSELALWWLGWMLLYGASLWMAYRQQLIWRGRVATWCLLLLPALPLLQYAEAGAPPWIAEVVSDKPFDGRAAEGWSDEWEDVYPVNVLVAYQQHRLEMAKLQVTKAALQNMALGATQAHPETAPELVVLVIGESSTATRWGLLGYSRTTTPKLHAQDGLLAFGDVVALSTATRTAIPGVISRKPVLRPNGALDRQPEPSLLKAYAETGYRTHWLSNQAPFGKYDSSIALYASEAADVRFFNPSTFRSNASYDERLLPALRELLQDRDRHLVVLHTLGSHFDYALRYPDEFDHFQPSTKAQKQASAPDAAQQLERISNSYDNSILYTDHVLSEVIQAVKAQNRRALVAYFSDHGEDVPGGRCRYVGVRRLSEAAYRVPVVFWFSEELLRNRMTAWEVLRRNREGAYTTQAMYATLLKLSGIELPGGLPEASFLTSPAGKDNERVVGMGERWMDFDKARARNACLMGAQP